MKIKIPPFLNSKREGSSLQKSVKLTLISAHANNAGDACL